MTRVLIGCEESGKIRRACRALGLEAWSNDLLPPRDGSEYHLQMDVHDAIDEGNWDYIIVHPECTEMAVCGNRTYAGTQARAEAIEWTLRLWFHVKDAAKKGCALENPASVIWPHIRPFCDQVQFVQPHMFGHLETKKTGFALHKLPPLIATNDVYEEMIALPQKERERIFRMPPGPNRKRDRSETFEGIAKAIAEQWCAA